MTNWFWGVAGSVTAGLVKDALGGGKSGDEKAKTTTTTTTSNSSASSAATTPPVQQPPLSFQSTPANFQNRPGFSF